MRFVRSSLIGSVVHGWSTRLDGVSTGRYASLNVGARWGDDAACVAENHRRLADAAGYEHARLYTARQVHGACCVRVDGRAPHEVAALEADALVATTPGVTVGVYTADCVPILYSDGAGRVAAAHAGWRGTLAGVAVAALDALVDAGARAGDIRVALGPSIGPCCFEVGEEVAEPFERLVPDAVLRPADRRPHVDLWRANAFLLERAGVSRERLDARPECTVCHPQSYFSFRRDGGQIGQMLAFVRA